MLSLVVLLGLTGLVLAGWCGLERKKRRKRRKRRRRRRMVVRRLWVGYGEWSGRESCRGMKDGYWMQVLMKDLILLLTLVGVRCGMVEDWKTVRMMMMTVGRRRNGHYSFH
jgi:hypothetical protein